MNISFDLNGKEITITHNELGARLWPFGKWDVVFKKGTLTHQRCTPTRKEVTVDTYFRYVESKVVDDVWIEKIGGFFDGIRFKPRKGKGRG